MSPLELKRTKLELLKVTAARQELELRIDERLEEIERIKQNIKIQMDKEAELNQKIQAVEKK